MTTRIMMSMYTKLSDARNDKLRFVDFYQLYKLNTRPSGRVRYLLASVLTHFDFDKREKRPHQDTRSTHPYESPKGTEFIEFILRMSKSHVNCIAKHFCKVRHCDSVGKTAQFDIASYFEYACQRPGRPGAAEPSKPRQGRKTATVRKCLWVPPITCPDICRLSYVCLSTQGIFLNCFTVGLKQNLKFT